MIINPQYLGWNTFYSSHVILAGGLNHVNGTPSLVNSPFGVVVNGFTARAAKVGLNIINSFVARPETAAEAWSRRLDVAERKDLKRPSYAFI